MNEQGDYAGALEALNAYLALEQDQKQREAISGLMANIASRVEPDRQVSTLQLPVAPHAQPTWARIWYGSLPAFLARWGVAARRPLSWFSAKNLTDLRRAQVATGGESMIDRTVEFDSLWDVFAYVPRALAVAYLAPFPSQWAFTRGASGIMRPMSAVEVVLIALLVPAMVAGSWRRALRFRPEEWVLIVFIGIVAIGHGVMMPNAGTLFRLRLQFLFPSLILASTALPEFAYRFFDAVSRWSVRVPSASRRLGEQARHL